MSYNRSEIVLKAKERGDKFYREGYHKAAASEYSICIQNCHHQDSDLIIYYSNRCACYLQLNQLSDAISDAQVCIRINPRWVKGYQRLGRCYERMQKLSDAIAAYEQALQIEPDNMDIQRALNDCRDKLHGHHRDSTQNRPNPPNYSNNINTFDFNETWVQTRNFAQQALFHFLTWWTRLDNTMRLVYVGGIIFIIYYFLFSGRGYDYDSYGYDNYNYGFGYGRGGGLSLSSMAMILGAAYIIPPKLSSILGPELARPFFGMSWSTFLWLISLIVPLNRGNSSGFFGSPRGFGFDRRRRYY